MIRAGELRHSITIQQKSAALDSAGQQAESWTAFETRHAAVVRTPGKEIVGSAMQVGRVPTVFRLRHVEGVTNAMRVLFGTRVLKIVSATDPDGRKEELLITADENIEALP